MNLPDSLAAVDRRGAIVRRFDRDGASGIVVDFGPSAEATSVDVVGNTALVVTDDDQFEFELPEGANDVTVNNGMLTIVD